MNYVLLMTQLLKDFFNCLYYVIYSSRIFVTADLKGIWKEVVWGNPRRTLSATAGFRTKFKTRISCIRRKGHWWL